jgi:hypothetical protein
VKEVKLPRGWWRTYSQPNLGARPGTKTGCDSRIDKNAYLTAGMTNIERETDRQREGGRICLMMTMVMMEKKKDKMRVVRPHTTRREI